MHSSRNFLLVTTLAAAPLFTPLLAVLQPVQAQTQVVSQNGIVYQSPTRPQVFKETNAMSGQKTQYWGNDRDADRDRDRDRNRRHDRDNRDENNAPNACAPGTTVVAVPVYPGTVYPGYAPYPTYGGYGVPSYPYGGSVTISTPGYNDGTFNVFPSTTTVTAFGSAPVVSNYYGYGNYPSYPAYPTYAPNLQGYRGAATPGYNVGFGTGYNYNGGSFPGGAFIAGSNSGYSNGYSTGFNAGYSNGQTGISISRRGR